ncbi:MAG TPA: hypothetical protein ENI82_02865 [Bacteroidetes bacterium]|nr:hypothetical protein [Bacteroidota bacterium]
MSTSFYKRIIRSYFWTSFSYVINFARQFVLVPLFLKFVGKDEYSYWLIVMAAIGILMTVNHGYFQYVSNKVNLDYRVDREKAVKEFRSAFRFSILQLMILVAIAIFLSTSFMFPAISEINIRNIDEYKLNFVFLFLAFSGLIFSMFSGLLAKLYEPVKKENYLYRFNFIYKIIDLIVLIVSLWVFKDLLIIAICVTIFRLIVLFLFALDVKKIAPDFFPWWKEGSIKYEIINFKRSTFLILSNFIERFQHDGLVLYVSHFLGETMVPLFATTKTVGNSATGGVASIINPALPEMQANYAQKKWKNVLKIIFINISLSSFVISLFFILISPYIQYLFEIWTDHKLQFDKDFYFYVVSTAIIFNFSYNYLSLIRAFNFTKNTLLIVVVKVGFLFTIPLFLNRTLAAIGKSMIYSEIAGLIVAFVFIILIFPVTFIKKVLKLTIISFIPSLFAIFSVYLLIKNEGNLFLLIIIYLFLFGINILVNGRSEINKFIKKINSI